MKKIKVNKRDIIVLIVIACIIIFVCGKYIIYENMQAYKFANKMETISIENANPIFRIDKIVLYSSASAVDNSEGETLQDLNICQYTDIAIYIDNTSAIEDLTDENTVKELYIDNIQINSDTGVGDKSLAYKSYVNYGKFKLDEQSDEQQEDSESTESTENTIEITAEDSANTENINDETTEENSADTENEEENNQEDDGRINFEILYTNEDNEKSDYKNPTFYTDCSNPITLGYVNENIVTGYAVSTEDTQIKFDGNILQSVGVNLDDIQCNISFDVHIKNNKDEEFTCGMDIDIPLESDDKTIYDGYMYGMQNNLQDLYKFFKN